MEIVERQVMHQVDKEMDIKILNLDKYSFYFKE
jgi:hypothetical protein